MIFDADDMYELEEDYKAKLEKKDKEIERLNNNWNKLKNELENVLFLIMTQLLLKI